MLKQRVILAVALLVAATSVIGLPTASAAVAFTETWEFGEGGWLFAGTGNSIDCTVGNPGCSLKQDPLSGGSARSYAHHTVSTNIPASGTPLTIDYHFRASRTWGDSDSRFVPTFQNGASINFDHSGDGDQGNNGFHAWGCNGAVSTGRISWPSADTWYLVRISLTQSTQSVVLATATGSTIGVHTFSCPGITSITKVTYTTVNWGGPSVVYAYDGLTIDDGGGSCVNNPPTAPAITGADGLGSERNYGWARSLYAFTLQAAVDPNGDPLTYAWNWGDGHTSTGTAGSHTYLVPGEYRVVVSVTDSPVGRGCAPTEAFTRTSAQFTFTVIEPFTIQLTAPQEGSSCIEGRSAPGVVASVIVGTCWFSAEVDTGGAPASLVAKVAFRIDGDDSHDDTTRAYMWTYDSLEFAPGTRVADARVYVTNDKYENEFEMASNTFAFVNVGAGTG